MFHSGQRVRCVNVTPTAKSILRILTLLALGEEYTILTIEGGDGIVLEEIAMPLMEYRGQPVNDKTYHPSYYSWRFRPAKTTDIGLFKGMLVKPPSKLVPA